MITVHLKIYSFEMPVLALQCYLKICWWLYFGIIAVRSHIGSKNSTRVVYVGQSMCHVLAEANEKKRANSSTRKDTSIFKIQRCFCCCSISFWIFIIAVRRSFHQQHGELIIRIQKFNTYDLPCAISFELIFAGIICIIVIQKWIHSVYNKNKYGP